MIGLDCSNAILCSAKVSLFAKAVSICVHIKLEICFACFNSDIFYEEMYGSIIVKIMGKFQPS